MVSLSLLYAEEKRGPLVVASTRVNLSVTNADECETAYASAFIRKSESESVNRPRQLLQPQNNSCLHRSDCAFNISIETKSID